MRFVPIAAGEFTMGSDQKSANWDEQPLRKVTISSAFFISETEVTAEQLLRYRSALPVNPAYSPYAAGVSWRDAMAFCAWLSLEERRPYRLPTEAEWEYVCRAGRPDGAESRAVGGTAWETAPGVANPWGVKNLLSGPVEWCADWYGEYGFGDATDPVGPEAGFTRVVRGGYLDTPQKFKPEPYRRPSNRAGAPSKFGSFIDGAANPQDFGLHRIGFRVVVGPRPRTSPTPFATPYARQGVKRATTEAARGPDPATPYFRKRRMLPIPPEDTKPDAINRTGLHPSLRAHNHRPGFAVLPNGDALLIIDTSHHEYEPEASLMAARLRFGAEQWDMPAPMFDTPGANDHAPLLWLDGNQLWLFWGHPYAEGHYPFQYVISRDFGATWSDVSFPQITGPLGDSLERPQPINTVLKDRAGTIYLAVDAADGGPLHSQSMLWKTANDGTTWQDTLGRTFGRHTTFAMLKDDSILGLGGKNSHVDQFMPRAISRDGGRSYELGKTPFSQLNSDQRPSLLRLASGRLFFCGDFQPSKNGTKPASIKEDGCYVALSDDEAETWRIKRLPGAFSKHRGGPSVGYSVARQAPNGLIHLVTTLNHPALHFELNEAWILGDATFADDDPAMERSAAAKISGVQTHMENFRDGMPRVAWSSGVGDDGRVLLDGAETWFHPNGAKLREATYKLGVKTGAETYWALNGTKIWEWQHRDDGTGEWTTFWPDGTKRSVSTWKNHELISGTDKFFEHGAK